MTRGSCAVFFALLLVVPTGAFQRTRQVSSSQTWQAGEAGSIVVEEALAAPTSTTTAPESDEDEWQDVADDDVEAIEALWNGTGTATGKGTGGLDAAAIANVAGAVVKGAAQAADTIRKVAANLSSGNSSANVSSTNSSANQSAANSSEEAASATEDSASTAAGIPITSPDAGANTSNQSKAVVHVTIDIEELPEPDNETIIRNGVESAVLAARQWADAASKSMEFKTASTAALNGIALGSLQVTAQQQTHFAVEGLANNMVRTNCTTGKLMAKFKSATGVSLANVLRSVTTSAGGTCRLSVDSSEADAAFEKALAARIKKIAAEADANLSATVGQVRQVFNDSLDAVLAQGVNGTDSELYGAVEDAKKANKSLLIAMEEAVQSVNGSMEAQTKKVVDEFNSQLGAATSEVMHAANQKLIAFVNDTEAFAGKVENATKLGPVQDAQMQLYFADNVLDEAMDLARDLQVASNERKVAEVKAATAWSAQQEAKEEMSYWVNVSVAQSHEVAEALVGLGTPEAKYDAVKVANLTAEAQKASEKAGELGAEHAAQEAKYRLAAVDSVAKAEKEYLIAQKLATEMEVVLNTTAAGLKDVALEANRTLRVFHDINISFPKNASLAEEGAVRSSAGQATAISRTAVKAGRVSALLDVSAPDEPRPGNVTVHVDIDGGNASVIGTVIRETERSLKDLFGAEAAVQVTSAKDANASGGELIVQATVPDVNAQTVRLVVDTTAKAIKNVLGDDVEEEGQVEVNGAENASELDEKEILEANSSKEVLDKATQAGEEVFGEAQEGGHVRETAPRSGSSDGGGGSSEFPLNVTLIGLILLLVLGIALFLSRPR